MKHNSAEGVFQASNGVGVGVGRLHGVGRSGVSLRGASQIEKDRKAILEEVKVGRERRKYEKELPKAVSVIQRYYRAVVQRRIARQRFEKQWMDAYGGSTGLSLAQNMARMSRGTEAESQEIMETMMPLCFAIHIPVGSPDMLWNEKQYVYVPEEAGKKTLRGTLTVVLSRLNASQDMNLLFKHNFRSKEEIDEWIEMCLFRLKKLLVLCFFVLSCDQGSDTLLQSAAARILEVVSDPKSQLYAVTLTLKSVDYTCCTKSLYVAMIHWWKSIMYVSAHRVGKFYRNMRGEDCRMNSLKALERNGINSAIRSQFLVSRFVAQCDPPHAEIDRIMEDVSTKCLVESILGLPNLFHSMKQSMIDEFMLDPIFFEKISHIVRHEAVISCNASFWVTSNYCTWFRHCLSVGGQLPALYTIFSNVFYHLVEIILNSKIVDLDEENAAAGNSMVQQGAHLLQICIKDKPMEFSLIYTLFTYLHLVFPKHQELLYGLAFDRSYLKFVWKDVSNAIGLPYAVPVEASSWKIHSLAAGLAIFSQEWKIMMYHFCTIYLEYLRVVDDIEFHEDKELLSSENHRAIAATVSYLVFRSYLPLSSSIKRTSKDATSMNTFTATVGNRSIPTKGILEVAAAVSRELHERNCRRKFCSTELWLFPFHESVASGIENMDGKSILELLAENKHERESGDCPSPNQFQMSGILGVFSSIPHCIPFEERVEIFRGLTASDKKLRRYDRLQAHGGPPPHHMRVHRSRILEDLISSVGVNSNWKVIRGPIRVKFVSDVSGEEAGIDMSGLTRELIVEGIKAATDPNRGIFSTTTVDKFFYPTPFSTMTCDGVQVLQAAGAMIGKALYEGILVHAPLAAFFVSRLQDNVPTLDDLQHLDPEIYKSLITIKRLNNDDIVEQLGLDFSVESDVFGKREYEELIPNGASTPVTSANKLQYIHLMADWHLRRRMDPSVKAFKEGLQAILPLTWLKIFSPRELNMLLGGGVFGSIDIDDMRKHCQYMGGYTNHSRVVRIFWKTVREMAQEDLRALLQFVTSSSGAPLGGFKYLNPPLTIQRVEPNVGLVQAMFKGAKDDRLPSASTCSNTLRLPAYRLESTLRDKLLYAIRSNSGFELS